MNTVANLFLFPGDVVCNLFNLPQESDHRMVLRSFFNIMIWGGVGVGTAFYLAL